jgi:hypothetical protein
VYVIKIKKHGNTIFPSPCKEHIKYSKMNSPWSSLHYFPFLPVMRDLERRRIKRNNGQLQRRKR